MNDRFSADDLSRKSGLAPRAIDLAHTPAFTLGPVEVRPQSRELITADRRELLEPLVMQVLVALHSAKGATLSRDDLIDACWGGRAVSDDAISRVVSRLRTLGRALGGFEVETIPKIGYRLVTDERATRVDHSPATPMLGRRGAMVGAAVVAATAAGVLIWQKPWRHSPKPEAVKLFELGLIAQREGLINQIRQAISYFQEAVRLDPLYADAWGALALANTHILEGYGDPKTEGAAPQLVAAAQRALELEPNNADARLALVLLKPYFHNWLEKEQQLREMVALYPRHWLARGRLAVLYYDVGRINEGIEIHRELKKSDPLLPVRDAFTANALLNAGRWPEADALLAEAEGRWPGHPSLWEARYRYYLYSAEPRSAEAFVSNPKTLPTGYGPAETGPFLRLARAAATRRPTDVAASIRDQERLSLEDPRNVSSAALAFAILGRDDLVFAALERYFFNEGDFGAPAPINRMTRRYARSLFAPPLAAFRDEKRFADVLGRVGLEDYWRRSGTVPDFRRG